MTQSTALLDQTFPEHQDPVSYASAGLAALRPFGFTPANTLAAVSVCRDELCEGLSATLGRCWGESFNLSGLAGVPLLGRTGFSAALHHAPDTDGTPRFAFFAFPHIAISSQGEWGRCSRPGQAEESSACGALSALFAEGLSPTEESKDNPQIDLDDLEQSALRSRLLPKLSGPPKDLLDLSMAAADLARSELELRVEEGISSKADYGLFIGVQIHTPSGDRVAPLHSAARIGGRHFPLPLFHTP